MKFTLQTVKNGGCRLGIITELGRNGSKSTETPMCMLYTRGGSAPHLTLDVLRKIQRVPPIAHIYLSSLLEHVEAVAEFKEGVAKFCGMQDFSVYCSLHDPSTERPPGYNEKAGSALWTKGGKMKLDAANFVKVQEAFQPDFCQALYDGDTNKDSTRKRVVKAVDRTLSFLEQIQESWSKSENLKNTCLFGVIEGGYNLQERERSAKETTARKMDGYVIAGFHNYGPSTENFDIAEVKDICNKTMEYLPDDKLRIMHGVWRPDRVLAGIQLGIDLFDSSYPYVVTERGSALVFRYKEQEPENGNSSIPQGFEINLKNKIYFDDFEPLLEGCTCYTCKNFTRSYINHLLNTSELLSSVLLMTHNFHHYFEFFHHIRQSLKDGSFDELSKFVQKQAPECQLTQKQAQEGS